jgi:GT2 family glycosyltransferase
VTADLPQQTTTVGRTTIAVVTHDSAPHIGPCLASLERELEQEPEASILVVDNASRDGTAELVRAASGRVELIVNASNGGFGAACNQAIRRAHAAGSEFVYLLNPDTVVAPSFLRAALEVASRDAAIAAVQSLLLLDPEPELLDSAGNRLHFLGFGYCALHRRPRAEAPADPVEIAFPSGAGVLLRVDALLRIGLLRDDLELFCEDLDLGWRLRLAGYRSLLAPRSVVRHRHDFLRHREKYFFLERNRFLVLLANYSARSLLLLGPLLAVNEVAILAISCAQGWWREKLRSWDALLRPAAWRQTRAARARVAAIRAVPDREVARWFTPRMELDTMGGVVLRRIVNPILSGLWAIVRPLL